MKKLSPLALLGLVLLFIPRLSHAQEAGELLIYADYEIHRTLGGNYHSPGVRAELYVSDEVSLNWRFGPIFSDRGYEGFHYNPGPGVVGWMWSQPLLDPEDDYYSEPDFCDPYSPWYDQWQCEDWHEAQEEEEDENGFFGALACRLIGTMIVLILPEGATLHLPLTEYIEFDPYLNPFGVERMSRYSESLPSQRTTTTELGFRLRFHVESTFSVTANLGYKWRHGDIRDGRTMGFSLHWYPGY